MASSNKTENLQLPSWLETDRPEMNDYNDAFVKIDNYSKKQNVLYFDTVNEMKNYDLKLGQVVETLGYYEINDGGGSSYVVSNEEDFVSELLTNSLYANLIINNNTIYVNSLGVKKGEDCSEILTNIIEKMNAKWLENDYKYNVLMFNGEYLINKRIIIPPCIRLRGEGFASFKTNVVDDSVFHITYLTKELPTDFLGNKQDYVNADIMSFPDGCVIKNTNGIKQGTCIEIGTREDWGYEYTISRYKLENFRIFNYDIAMVHNIHHVYIGNYERISFEDNNVGVQFAKEDSTVKNSGENMTFTQCILALNKVGLKYLCDGFDCAFTNSSLDFIVNVIEDVYGRGYKRISFVNCHIEGWTKLIERLGTYSQVNYIGCNFTDTYRSGQWFNKENIYPTSRINFTENKILNNEEPIADPNILCQDVIRIGFKNNFWGHGYNAAFFIKDNNLLGGCFDKIPTGDIELVQGGKIGDFTITFMTPNINSIAQIEQTDVVYEGQKSLVLSRNIEDGSSTSINIETDFIDSSSLSNIFTNAFCFNAKNGLNIVCKQYDDNLNLLSESDNYHYDFPDPGNYDEQWWMSAFGAGYLLERNCSKIKVEFQFSNMNRYEIEPVDKKYKIGALIIN